MFIGYMLTRQCPDLGTLELYNPLIPISLSEYPMWTLYFLLAVSLSLFLSLPVSDQREFAHLKAHKILNFSASLIGCSRHSIDWIVDTNLRLN